MLRHLGHDVYHYGCEGSNPDCTENVAVITEQLRHEYYPTDFHRQQFSFDPNDQLHLTFNQNCIEEIKKRSQLKDFLLCAWGWGHKPIADQFQSDMLVVESGVGYEDIFANFRVFESYTWMSHVYGLKNIKNGQAYDAVIPNFFDPSDFEYSDQKEDWFLYLGRIVQRKGVDVAVQVTKEIGAKLVIAGQGMLQNDSESLNISDPHVEHVGFADIEKRKMLLSKARAVFMPTYYIEPFGGVSIEAAMSGTPVISSDWGVFGENVIHGSTGFRCRTFEQYCWAAKNVQSIASQDCRNWAMANFTTDRVALMYQEYFEMLYGLWDKGWYEKKSDRDNLDWLVKDYPAQPTPAASNLQVDRSPVTGFLEPNMSRPKVAIWSHLEWAFGHISENLQKLFDQDYSVQLFSWEEIHLPETFDHFDLIYVPTWPARLDFLHLYPTVSPEQVICGIHGVAELFNQRFEPGGGRKFISKVQPDLIDSFQIPTELASHLSSVPAIGVVNRTLYERLKAHTGLENLFLTECGVDAELFEPVPVTRSSLQVAYPLQTPEHFDGIHGYDVKRFHLIRKMAQQLEKDVPGVYFIQPDNHMPHGKMARWYPLGDVHICVSHSEGGPLVALESAACGLVQIATPVGVIPDIVDHGVSGFLINGTTETEMYDEVCHSLRILQNDRELLRNMKIRTRQAIESNWTWAAKKTQWKDLFNKGLEAIQATRSYALERKNKTGH